MPDCRRQRLVSRRVEERAARTHRTRPLVRAPDVRRLSPSRSRLLPATPGGGCRAQRIDEHRSHQLLGGRPDRGARARVVARIGSDGISPAGADRCQIHQSARRRAQRAASELREPPLRPRRDGDGGGALSQRASVSLADDWVPDDLRATTLDEVRAFFAQHYHPANASLAIAGAVSADEAFTLAERYFGEIATGPARTP